MVYKIDVLILLLLELALWPEANLAIIDTIDYVLILLLLELALWLRLLMAMKLMKVSLNPTSSGTGALTSS